MILTLTDFQIIALRLFLRENSETAPKMITKALTSIVNTPDIEDVTKEGYLCLTCGKISQNPAMTPEQKVVRWHNKKPYICNSHYDGCKGWD